MNPRLVSIQVGMPKRIGTWRTAIFKSPVTGPVRVGFTNLVGDGQANLKHHGGPDKAVLAYSADHYPYWREHLARPNAPFGAFGENLTIAGLSETTICIGDTWAIGSEVKVQVSQPRQPCSTLARKWERKSMVDEIVVNGKSGWYLRVLAEGMIEAGQELTLLDRPLPKWTISEAHQVMFHRRFDLAAARELAEMALLSESWRGHFANLVEATAG